MRANKPFLALRSADHGYLALRSAKYPALEIFICIHKPSACGHL